jgi:aryl-alcohol dehydrogenase-like predicted oxidoreductase
MTHQRVAELPADDWRIRNTHFQEPLLTKNLKLAEKLAEIARRHRRTPGEAALAWVLHHPDITAAIVGIRTKEQVSGVQGAMTFRLSQDEVDEINAFRKSLDAT